MRTHHHGRPPQNKVSYMSKECSKMIWKEFRVCYDLPYTVLDVLWCQPIKLIQVVSTSEFQEY